MCMRMYVKIKFNFVEFVFNILIYSFKFVFYSSVPLSVQRYWRDNNYFSTYLIDNG